MNLNVFNLENFNIIQDEENYYFFRALNMADNNDIEQGITTSENGKIERIRTDRERFDGETKYSEDSEISLEELYDHIKMHYRKDTNCISLTSNANVVVNYGRGSYKDRYVMIKIPKKEFGEKTVTAGQYMLQELYSKIQQEVEKLPEEEKGQILSIFDDIEDATEIKTLQDIIAKRYTAKTGEVNPSKAHLRKGITYSSPKARISSYQALDEEQLLEVNKVYAKLAILENEDILKHVIPHSSNSKLREAIGNAFSSTEVIHYGDIKEENIIEISKELADIFALIQQVNDIDENRIKELKRVLIIAVGNGSKISQISDITSQVKDNISIEEMYELTEGKVEYGKANSIVKNMFYLSKSRQNAIALSNVLAEILGDNLDFEDIIQHIRENGFRVEPEIISRKSGKGVELSESVNLNLQKEEQLLIDEIKELSSDELDIVLQNGGLYNARDIITKTFSNISENEKIDKSRYYAEAIVAQYNWQNIGIEEIKVDERNELIARLQEKNCAEIYERLKETGMEESRIPTVLFNIAMRDGFYQQYKEGNLVQLLDERQDILQDNINIELVERFLGYYDVENTGIKLKDYQQRANDNINRIFENHKFAQVILPTGAGKSFVALAQMQKYVEEHPNEKMLYLAPQEEILNQIKKYIKNYVHGKQKTFAKSEDAIIAEIFPNITFETYSGLLAKRGQEVIKNQYGMIVLDELHRTGAKEWEGKIDTLLENQTDNVKVLGITATPTRDMDGRHMAEETAKKLGYTDKEIKDGKHRASNLTLETAIRLGYVVNPKLVYCKYDLISSGKMDELREKIDNIEDEGKRAEELQKYNELRAKLNKEIDNEMGEDARKKLEEDARKNLDSGIGKEEILRQNVKKGGKYIVFIPVSDQGDIEDEYGNRIGTKTGEDKILSYQEYLNKVFKGTDIVPQLYAMSGAWNGKGKDKNGNDKNQQELNAFESDNSDKTKFMVVMNKANEGLHIAGVDGIIWFRALDQNSRILYLQQLGRAIYALDEDNPLPDDKRPTVIDLANNSLTVKMEKEFENIEPIGDLEALTIVTEWINEHDGMIPDRSSSNKQEQHYYAILRRIQNKYCKYLDGFDNFEDLTDEEKARIQEIIDLATEIDLWNIDLPPIPKTRGSKEEFDPFSIEGVLRDFVEFEEEIDNIERKTVYEEVIEFLETHNGEIMRSVFSKNGKHLKRKEMSVEQRKELNLYSRWMNSIERQILEECAGRQIQEIPEEYREKITRLREFGLGKTLQEQIIEFVENSPNHDLPRQYIVENKKRRTREEMTEKEKYEVNLRQRWYKSVERQVLEEYTGKSIEEVPEEYREFIKQMREYGYGIKEKTLQEQIIEFIRNSPNHELPSSSISENGKKLARNEMSVEQRKEVNLYGSWRHSEEKKILKEYTGRPIKEVPEEYREFIKQMREYGYGKTLQEQIIEFIKDAPKHKLPRAGISGSGKNKIREEMTQKEMYETDLRKKWDQSIERQILEGYAGKPIEEIPEEYREFIKQMREYGYGIKEKSLQKQMIEFIQSNPDKKLPKKDIFRNRQKLKRNEMTQEEDYESRLRGRWNKSEEKKILEEYTGKPIEEVPEEYREFVRKMRKLGFGLEIIKRSISDQVIEFLEMHDGRMMQSAFQENEKKLKIEEMTQEQQEEVKLYARWINSKEKRMLEEYAGKLIEEIPEEYREFVKVMREYGLEKRKGRLENAKKQRDYAKIKNNQAKELEEQVAEQLKKRGKNHEEQ